MRLFERIDKTLSELADAGLERELRVHDPLSAYLNLANNDYLELSGRPEIRAAAVEAISKYGASSSASPLVSGFGPAHASLLERVKRWHGFEQGLIWNSGFAANSALLAHLPQRGDLVLADRLIHRSMIDGMLRSGARIARYAHCDLDTLERSLSNAPGETRQVFVVTESLFSMDGDYPDLDRMAELKRRFGFFWIVDEAHAIGWYGHGGSGLVEAFGRAKEVDALVGTLGKGLGSSGAYTLFHDERIARFLVNRAAEFIYSTYLPPACAAVAEAAIDWVEAHPLERERGRERSRQLRRELSGAGFSVADGDSPIVPVVVGPAERALRLAQRLRKERILVGAIRPPTVPRGSSRLRVSVKSTLANADVERLVRTISEEEAG